MSAGQTTRQPAMKTILALLFLLPGCLSAQQSVIDSLRRLIAQAPNRETRIRLQFEMGTNMHQADSIEFYGHLILNDSKARNDMRGIGYGERLLGDAAFYRLQYPNTIEHYLRADSAFQAIGEKRERLVVLSNTAYALSLSGRSGDAIFYSAAELDVAEQLGDKDAMGQSARNIADCLTKQKKFEEAIPYVRKSIAWETTNSPADMAYLLLGISYEGLNQRDSALVNYEIALKKAKETGIRYRIATGEQFLGSFYLHQHDIPQAEVHLKEAMAYYESQKDRFSAPGILKTLSDLELERNNPRAAIEYGERALEAMQFNRQALYWGPVHANLYRAYAALGQTDKALEHVLAWKTASDSIAVQDNARKIAEVEAHYNSREQESVIARQQFEIGRQRALLLIGLLALLLVSSLAYVAYFRARGKKREADHTRALHEIETRQLRELDRVKSAFFANISHEFRTPLTLLIGPLREMETGKFRGNALKYFAIMRRNAERLLQLVNQLLDLSRLENGRLNLDLQAANLTAALRAIACAFESLADHKQIHFDVFVPRAPVWAFFDRDKLEKIVSNLLANAFKFTPEEGTVRLTVEVNRSAPDSERLTLQITVSDTGIGIPEAQLPFIFERFYQVENNSPDTPEGSGIGLALTKELVQLYSGTIQVQSIENQGTTFIVILPVRGADPALANESVPDAAVPADGQAPLEAPALAPAAHSAHTASVLIVEDNPDLRAYIATQLEGQFRILTANNGAAALPIAASEVPDLILTDLMMPEMDGLQLTQHLKDDPRTSHIPVVMLTAKAAREDRIGGLQTGAEAYLTKPFDAEELRALVARLTDQRKLLQEKYSRMVVLGAAPLTNSASLDEQFLQQVLRVIEEYLDDDMFGVEQLAAGVNMSRSNLFRKLDALTGKSPTHLIRELRLTRAKQLLEQGAGNTTEVALMVGFNTPAYFVKCFVDQYGITPGELRKRKQAD